MNVRHQLRTVDLDALKGNVRLLREALPAGTRLLAVVKADAYGHGMTQVARAAIEAGAAHLAVATAEEGAALRHAGIRDVPVLVLGATTPDAARLGAVEGLTMTVCDPAMVRWMQDAARACGGQGLVHLKLDTGMGRIGARTEAEVAAVLAALYLLTWASFAPDALRGAWWCTAFSITCSEAVREQPGNNGQIVFRSRLAEWWSEHFI